MVKKDFMKYYVPSGYKKTGKGGYIACGAILLKKKIKVKGKTKIRKRFFPYKTTHTDKLTKMFLPTLEITLKKKKGVINLSTWMEKRIELDGYEIYAMSFGWHHGCKPFIGELKEE